VPGASDPDDDTVVHFTQIFPRYFVALGIPLLSGRELEQRDMGPDLPGGGGHQRNHGTSGVSTYGNEIYIQAERQSK